jgi:hypothetical protein
MELFSHFNYTHHASGRVDEGYDERLAKHNTARTLYLKIDDIVYQDLYPGLVINLIVGASVCNIDDTPSKKIGRETCVKMTNKETVWQVSRIDRWFDVTNQAVRQKTFLRMMTLASDGVTREPRGVLLTIRENLALNFNGELEDIIRISRT